MPSREEVDRHAAHHLVRPQRDREHGVHQPERPAGRHADEHPEEPRAGDVRAEDPEEGAHQHHALEPDVDDAAALGHDPARARRTAAAWRSAAPRRTEPTRRTPSRGWPRPTSWRRPRRSPPTTPAMIAPRPSRASPARVVATPAATAARASSSDGSGVRTSSGGSVMYQAIAPSATPAQPSCLVLSPVRDAAKVAPVTRRPSRHEPAGPAQHRQHQHVGAHDEHDEALDDRGQVRGQLGLEDRRIEVALRGPAEQPAEQQRGRHRPDRRVAARAARPRCRGSRSARSGCRWSRCRNCQPSTSIDPARPANSPQIAITST